MGAWRYLHEKFGKRLFNRFPFAPVSRFESASPATGSSHAHKFEQENLVRRAFGEAETKFHEIENDENNKQQANGKL
jgi:2-oxoglutarate dehydrogenase complex dehydrogenase (E1) component-like enzyme